jgi:hypothetical protein
MQRPDVDLRKTFPEVLRNGAKGTYLYRVVRDPWNVHSLNARAMVVVGTSLPRQRIAACRCTRKIASGVDRIETQQSSASLYIAEQNRRKRWDGHGSLKASRETPSLRS